VGLLRQKFVERDALLDQGRSKFTDVACKSFELVQDRLDVERHLRRPRLRVDGKR